MPERSFFRFCGFPFRQIHLRLKILLRGQLISGESGNSVKQSHRGCRIPLAQPDFRQLEGKFRGKRAALCEIVEQLSCLLGLGQLFQDGRLRQIRLGGVLRLADNPVESECLVEPPGFALGSSENQPGIVGKVLLRLEHLHRFLIPAQCVRARGSEEQGLWTGRGGVGRVER